MTSEREFVRQLQDDFPARPPVEVGIGDDGAVLHGEGRQIVVADMLLDGRHFQTEQDPPEQIGRKCIAVNLSDLAAMGARPTAAFVSVAFCRNQTNGAEFIAGLYRGIAKICERYEVTLAGGDTNSWDGPFAINVTLIGEPFGRHPILRSTARVGDLVFVTGALGGSFSTGHHLTFSPRLPQIEWLIKNDLLPTSLMDISDGLAVDLHRLAEASGVGATIHAEQIPISDRVPADQSDEARLQQALCDGEDFELLGTICEETYRRLVDGDPPPFKLIPIGVVTEANDILLHEAGTSRPLPADGWQHL